MKIKGFIKTSFMDWDGKIVSVIFLPGCTFRCPFCHNSELAIKPDEIETLPWAGIKEYLIESKDFLDGVCITGGEPTLTKDLPELCKEIKELGLKVKLDTNGTNSEMLNQLVKDKLVDFVAMDIKMPFEQYSLACGVNSKELIKAVKQSVSILMENNIEYEFRTTVVPTLHTLDIMEEISAQIKGAKKFVVQNFLPENTLDPELQKQSPFNKDQINEFIAAAKKNLDNVSFRGKV